MDRDAGRVAEVLQLDVEDIDQELGQFIGARSDCDGALFVGLAGEQLSEMAALKQTGCVGVSNAMLPLANTLVQRRAMEYAATFNLTVFLFASDHWLAGGGCAHEGKVATRLGLPGIPEASET